MRNFIDIVDTSGKQKLTEALSPTGRKRRGLSEPEFIKMVIDAVGPQKASHITKIDMMKIADANGVLVPMSITFNRELKVDAHHWNLSGDSAEDVEDKLAKETGETVEKGTEEAGETYQDALMLAKAKEIARLAAKGKIYIFGRKPKGAFFRIPGMEQLTAQLERMLARELEAKGDSTMEEQYTVLKDKVRLIASGQSQFIKSLLITGAPSSGKSLCLNTPIPTPNGWTTMGNLKIGDQIFDDQGQICNVTFATPIQYNRQCYKVTFDDGTSIIADADHNWFTSTNSSRYSEMRHKRIWKGREIGILKSNGNDQSYKRTFPSVVTTQMIADTLKVHGKYNHQITNSEPIMYHNDEELIINPYVYGVWLGDGGSISPTITSGNQDLKQLKKLLENENQYFKVSKQNKNGTWTISLSSGKEIPQKSKMIYKLRQLDVLGTKGHSKKHIPISYLRSSFKNRLALLQGLMDTDGTIDKLGHCEFTSVNKQLANDTYELICSLGMKATLTTGRSKINGIDKGEKYRIYFLPTLPVFRYERKLERIRKNYRHSNVRTIIECLQVDSVPVRCITVDSPSHLFLCSEFFIPTHNTYTVMETIKAMGLKEGRDFIVKKGRITVLSMYRTLIEQLNGLIIFDDCDSVVEDKNGINMLKGALDTDPVREISYDVRGTINTGALPSSDRDAYCEALSRALKYKQTPEDTEFLKGELDHFGLLSKVLKGAKYKPKSDEEDEESGDVDLEDVGGTPEDDLVLTFCRQRLPNKIDFKGRIIFISNLDESEWDAAILTRALYQNMNFSSIEMLDFIDRIKDKITTPGLTDDKKQEVMDFVRNLYTTGKLKRAVNFRLIQQAFDLALTDNWKKIVSSL